MTLDLRVTGTNTRRRPMWRCPACRREFANRNQSHSCGRHDLGAHFEGKPAAVRELFDRFLAEVRCTGPVTVLPEKTRIAFQVRMSFAAVQVRRAGLVGHLVLACRRERPCFTRIDSISRQNHVHHFRLASAADITPELCGFIREAYAVGEQRHLGGN